MPNRSEYMKRYRLIQKNRNLSAKNIITAELPAGTANELSNKRRKIAAAYMRDYRTNNNQKLHDAIVNSNLIINATHSVINPSLLPLNSSKNLSALQSDTSLNHKKFHFENSINEQHNQNFETHTFLPSRNNTDTNVVTPVIKSNTSLIEEAYEENLPILDQLFDNPVLRR